MSRHVVQGAKSAKKQSRKKATRRRTVKTGRNRSPSVGALQEQLDLRTRELREALEQQTATSEVLQIISSSPGDLKPVFQALLEKATRICGAQYGMLWMTEGDGFRASAMHNVPAALVDQRQREQVIHPGEEIPLGHLARTKHLIHIHDLKTEPGYINGFRPLVELVNEGSARTLLLVPLLKDDDLVGAYAIYRPGSPPVYRQADRAG